MKKNEKDRQHTIYDISARAGVSTATVSRVINGSDKVREKTRQRVLQVIEDCGYEPSALARGLGTGTMKTIGILCADVADLYLANAVSYLERELRGGGFNTVLNCTGYDYSQKIEGMREMERRRVDAIILVGSHYIELQPEKNQYILDASESIPVMMVNGYLDSENIFCNLSDEYHAYEEATINLLQAGCRDILFLYRETTYSQQEKLRGYQDTLAAAELPVCRELMLECDEKMEMVGRTLMGFYQEGHQFDAILATDDELAVGALKFAKSAKLRVPDDLCVIGCNNSVLSVGCEPELSSVDNQCELLCIETVDTLLKVLAGQEVARYNVLPSKFVPRGTTR